MVDMLCSYSHSFSNCIVNIGDCFSPCAGLPESDDPSEREEKLKEAWEYGEDHTRSVEVLYENLDGDGVLAKVHFTYNPSVSA